MNIPPFHFMQSTGDTMANIPTEKIALAQETALEQAQKLTAPIAESKTKGDIENTEFWEEHYDLFQKARMEWGRRHYNLYRFDEHFISAFIEPGVREAIEEKSISKIKSLIRSSEKDGVYKIKIFNQEFVQTFLEELKFQEESEIPMRRPNGMNRYGCILNELGFENFLEEFSNRLLKPIAHILFPRRVSIQDLTTEYGFVVKYHPDSDANLKEHADASTITVNTCLIPSEEDAPLFFKSVRELGEQQQDMKDIKQSARMVNVTLDNPGDVVFHLGQHIHGVSDVSSARSNMIIWMMGDYGYVRVAPYESHEVTTNQLLFQSIYGWN